MQLGHGYFPSKRPDSLVQLTAKVLVLISHSKLQALQKQGQKVNPRGIADGIVAKLPKNDLIEKVKMIGKPSPFLIFLCLTSS